MERSCDKCYVPGQARRLWGSCSASLLGLLTSSPAFSSQSLNIAFAGWNEANGASEDTSRFWSVQTGFGTHTETSSQNEILESSRTWDNSSPVRSLLANLGHKNNMHHTTEVVYKGSGHGTHVTTFQSRASAPSRWLSSSVPAASDKEAPPLPQEASHNNPDTSGNSPDVSHITVTFSPSLTRSYDQAGTALVVPHREVSEASAAEVKSDALLFLEPSVQSSTTHTSATVPLPWSQASHIVAGGSEAVPEHTEPPSFSNLPPFSVVSSVWHSTSTVTPEAPSFLPKQWSTRSSYVTSAAVDKWSDKAKIPSSTTAHLSKTASSGTGISRLLPVGFEQTTKHLLLSQFISTHVDDTRIRDYIQGNYKYSGLKSSPSPVQLEGTDLHSSPLSSSHSTPGFSQVPNTASFSESFVRRESRSFSEQELTPRSLSEDTTNWGRELGHTTGGERSETDFLQIGSTENSHRLSTSFTGAFEAQSLNTSLPDVSLRTIPHVEGVNSTNAVHLPDNITIDENVSMQTAHTVIPEGQFKSLAPYTRLDDAEARSVTSVMDSYTRKFEEDIVDVNNTDVYVSVTHITPHNSSLHPKLPEILTLLPEFSGSTLSDNVSFTSMTEKSEVSSVPESKTDLDPNLWSSISTSSPYLGTQLSDNSTVHTTVELHRNTTASEDKFNDSSPLSTQSFFEPLTNIPYLVTMSPTVNLRSSVSSRPEDRTFTSSKGDSEMEHTSTESTTPVFSHTVTPMHTFTVTSVGFEKVPLSTTAAPSTIASPSASTDLKVSGTLRGSISSPSDGISVTTMTPESLTPAVPSGTNGEGTQDSHNLQVTISPTVSTVSTAVTVPVTPTPRTTSEAPKAHHRPISTKSSVSTDMPSVRTVDSRTESGAGSSGKSVKVRIFIAEDQPPIIKEGTVQLLLQTVLTSESPGEQESPYLDSLGHEAVVKLRLFLERAPGFQDLQLSWTSGTAVVQSVATFNTERAVSWLGVPGALLDVTGLNEAVNQGLYVNRTRVEHITVGGVQSDLCSWLFLCPSGFWCMPGSTGNATCTSLCHTDYCKNNGICTHHHGQQPMCQCPVGDHFWFMGRQCDFLMTRQRLVGVCLGVLFSVVLLMAAVSFLVIRHFKAMLVQAKVDQTRSSVKQYFLHSGSPYDPGSGHLSVTKPWPSCTSCAFSAAAFPRMDVKGELSSLSHSLSRLCTQLLAESYRRFNHFDELSGRFWLRSWPGSADSLDNPAFSRSDELLHLRALDRSCCYHDDSLSIVSTCHGSGTHLNTIYAHGSQYNWNVSSSSINEFVADSGKASDLSVCSWPIEPIQWTPFPLLQQLGIQRPAKTSRPRSYCEGMELVDLEKTWTA